MIPLCIYHGGCPDGFTAAWVTSHGLGGAELYAASHGSPPPDVTGRDLVIVDFAYDLATTTQLLEQAASVVLLDHHVTALHQLAALLDDPRLTAELDMHRSGARIAFDHFRSALPPAVAASMEPIVAYVEDRDLWHRALPRTETVNAGLALVEHDLDAWDRLLEPGATDRLAADGEIVLRYRHRQIEAAVRRHGWMELGEDRIPVSNCSPDLLSDVADALARLYPSAPAVACYYDGDDSRHFSVRSAHLDVARLCERFGGGGHARAAGFRVPLTRQPLDA